MIKCFNLLAIFIFTAVSCANQGKQENTERKQLFDFDWKFAAGDHPGAIAGDFNDSLWQRLDLPHDWSIEGVPDPRNPSGNDGGYFPAGTGWYRKWFKAPSHWQGKRVTIYFEGIYMNSEVFLNGQSLGKYPYGYSSFFHDLTPYLKTGQENVIAVRVDNSQQKNSRWYSGSGIYRHVWLLVTDPVHVAHWGVSITTPDVSPEKATVRVKTLVKNETGSPQSIVLLTQLTGKNNADAGMHKAAVELQPNDEEEVIQTITVVEPLLWSPETPGLYQAHIRVMQGNKTIDATAETFGIRSIKFSAGNGFELNGQKVLLNGGCVHHDNGCLGARAYDRAEERKAELLKAAGFNAVRTAHNPPSEAFLNACDRLGLFVIDESFDCWREGKTPHDYSNYFDTWWRRDLESMVLRDRNHPAVVVWSTGNEIIERTSPGAVETATMLAQAIRSLDMTRPVTSAMTTWGQGWEIFDPLFAAHDIGGYNYQLHYAESDHERVPSRIMVQTESYPGDAFYCWDMVNKHPYIIGDFVWTALDYLGEAGIGAYYYPGEEAVEHWINDRYPWHGAYCGDIDLTGWRKPISHYRSLLYNGTEKLYMAVREPNPGSGEIRLTAWAVWPSWESWTWPGREGKEMQVEVYSRYPQVRLYLDDRLIGERLTTREQEFKAAFTLPYAPGVLKAAGVEDDKETAFTILKTAGEAAEIRLKADRKNILANGQDLSFVSVEITDQEGIIQPNADNRITFQVKGPGEIIGVDNANLKDNDPYVGNSRKTWNGRAMIVVKSTRDPGRITLRAGSPGLSEATVTLEASE